MPIIDARELLKLPEGNDPTDVVIGGIHFNRTVIEQFGYKLYSNGTLSNDSSCILTQPPYTPVALWANGTFINVTTCFDPVRPVGPRASAAMGFVTVFALCIIFTLMNLRKHGRLYLPVEKRFRPVGRRWQWYWMLFVGAAAFISLITDIDVDRYYLPQIPIVLSSFFWFLMQIGSVAVVWEAVRHWGSWMERQFIDPDPFRLRQDDRRAMFEFWLPLWFYLWLWLNFFMVVPRDWGQLELQRSDEQSAEHAIPFSTDARFKVAAFCLAICWLTILFSLRHSIQHYQPRNRGLLNRLAGLARFTPLRFLLLLPLAAALIAYQALCAWSFALSPLNTSGAALPIFLGGYAPSLLILAVQVVAGLLNPNEDKDLLRQRRARGSRIDAELGLAPTKPAWWRRLHPDAPGALSGGAAEGMRDRIARNVRELGGGVATARNIDRALGARAHEVELAELSPGSSTTTPATTPAAAPAPAPKYTVKSDRLRSERAMHAAARTLFPNAEPARDRRAELMFDGPAPPPYGAGGVAERGRAREQGGGPGAQDRLRPAAVERADRSTSTGGSVPASLSGPPQAVRSMLDV